MVINMDDNVIIKRIEVHLTKEDVRFVKWLADRDNVSFQRELKQLFYLQLSEEKDLYLEESKM